MAKVIYLKVEVIKEVQSRCKRAIIFYRHQKKTGIPGWSSG